MKVKETAPAVAGISYSSAKAPGDKGDDRRTKEQLAIELLQQWMLDNSGYDEENWPVVKRTLEENRLSQRRRFND